MNNDLRDRLVGADPLRTEPLPDHADVQRIRRTVLAEAGSLPPPFRRWRQPAWIAAGVVAGAIVIGASLLPLNAPGSGRPASVDTGARAVHVIRDTPSRRQLQFVTAGGTRIVWILNEELEEWNDR